LQAHPARHRDGSQRVQHFLRAETKLGCWHPRIGERGRREQINGPEKHIDLMAVIESSPPCAATKHSSGSVRECGHPLVTDDARPRPSTNARLASLSARWRVVDFEPISPEASFAIAPRLC